MKTLHFTELGLKIENDKDILGNEVVRLVNDFGVSLFYQVIEMYGDTRYEYYLCLKTNEKYNIKF